MTQEVLDRVLRENGWSLSEEQGVKHLHIDGEKVRYYDYPPAQYEIAVRKMILKNPIAELRQLIEPRQWPLPDLDRTTLEQ